MRLIRGIFTAAAVSFVAFHSPAAADTNCRLGGSWRLVAFYTEDVATNARVHLYGEHPRGSMTMTCSGLFSIQSDTREPEPVLSVWEDVARTFAKSAVTVDIVSQSGSYRLDGDRIMTRNNATWHGARDGYDEYDLTWNVGKSESDAIWKLLLMPNEDGGDLMLIESAPTPEPNRAGSTIVSRVIWARKPGTP